MWTRFVKVPRGEERPLRGRVSRDVIIRDYINVNQVYVRLFIVK